MKRYLILLVCLVAVAGCGAGGGSVPPGSSINLTDLVSVTNDNPDVRTDSQTTQITVKDLDGNGVINGKLAIKFVFTEFPSASIIADPSTAITMCDGTRIVNTTVEKETDDFGVYYLCLMYKNGGGLSYSGEVQVYSGDQLATTSLSVQ